MKRLLPILFLAVAALLVMSSVSAVFAEEKAPDEAIVMNNVVGFGFGVFSPIGDLAMANKLAGQAFPAFLGPEVFLRYWVTDAFAIEPRLQLNFTSIVNNDKKTTENDVTVDPAILFIIPIVKVHHTRFEGGVGFGINYMNKSTSAKVTYKDGSKTDTTSASDTGVAIPVQLGVEHFFAKWFSMEVGASCNLLTYDTTSGSSKKDGTTTNVKPTNTTIFDIDSTKLFLNFIVYTK